MGLNVKPEHGSYCLQDPQDFRAVEGAEEGRIIVEGGRGVMVDLDSGAGDDDGRDQYYSTGLGQLTLPSDP